MKPIFDIQIPQPTTIHSNLYLEIGVQGISFIVIDSSNNCLALATYHFPAEINMDKAAVHLKQIVAAQPILQDVFNRILVIYNYPKSVLIPHQFMNDDTNKEMLELLYGELPEYVIKKDFIYKQSIHNVYAVPKQIEAVVSYLFSAESCTHLYSLLPNISAFKRNVLYCIFGSSNFVVMLIKGGNLQIIQTFQYKSSDNVAYSLLQLCASFEVPVKDTQVLLNGMIDISSNLYFELNKYFLNLQLQNLPDNFEYPDEIKKYPSQYFSHLFALAACV